MHADFTCHDFAPHTHDAFVIAVTELGGARIKSRGVTDVARSSGLFVSNPEEPQSSWMGDSPRWRYRSMYLTQAAIDVVAEGLGIESVPYFTSNMIGDADLVRGFASLHQALEAGADGFREHELLISAFGHVRSSRQRRRSHRAGPPGQDPCSQDRRFGAGAICGKSSSRRSRRRCRVIHFPADRTVQALDRNHPSRLSYPCPAECGLPPSQARRFYRRRSSRGRVLRSECADEASQALLRHHATAICQSCRFRPASTASPARGRAESWVALQFQPIRPRPDRLESLVVCSLKRGHDTTFIPESAFHRRRHWPRKHRGRRGRMPARGGSA